MTLLLSPTHKQSVVFPPPRCLRGAGLAARRGEQRAAGLHPGRRHQGPQHGGDHHQGGETRGRQHHLRPPGVLPGVEHGPVRGDQDQGVRGGEGHHPSQGGRGEPQGLLAGHLDVGDG